MQVARRALIASALAMPALPRLGRAAEFVWRVAHTAPASFPLHVRLTEAAAIIELETGGRVQLEIQPDSRAGNQMGVLGQLRAGTLEMAPVTGQLLSGSLAVAAAPMTGFAFAGYDRLWSAVDGALGQIVRDQLARRLGLVAMAKVWDLGFRQITTSVKPVRSAADMDGLRIRIAGDADLLPLFRGLKAVPMTIPLGGLLQALRAKAVDGQEGLLPLVVAARVYDVQADCALTNHVWDGQWMCVNAAAWNRLPDRWKPVVADALNNAAERQRADFLTMEEVLMEFLSAKGMIVTRVDPASFRERLRAAGYYKELRTRLGDEAWAALEKAAGKLV